MCRSIKAFKVVIYSVYAVAVSVRYVFFSSEAFPADMFDVKTCQGKLAEHYQTSAKVPTTAWSSVLQTDLEQIYTRLSWVKQEQTSAGSSQEKLEHYTEIFTKKTKDGVVAKRILVQGETGIGKTTFVKKLLVDWSNLQEAKMDEKRKDVLRKFDLVVSINLKEVSKCQTFKEVVSRSRLFSEDDEKSVDDLLCYIRKNQDKVLLVFDGYDEYRTGSEAEERYGSRSNSPIFSIFHKNILRECTVLVTSRSSRSDEIRGPADIQAEITGFNMPDRKDFMRKMLDSQTEVDDLLWFLRKSNLNDLARVPLLSLFFCLLWKVEKKKLMELTERKAKLYQAIVKHILQHSHRRHSSSQAAKLKEADYEEILAEIGKVALAGLLKGDLLFEVGQLPEKVRGEESVIVGLFQFCEYGPSLEPMEMVSFIHKSIQEYLAAWYLIYSCVSNGNLGEIEQHAVTLENCEVLENVFQFVCGLSDEGAMKVFEHLKSVRISDPSLDLSKTIPDVETETDVPLCDVTYRHERFSNLINDSFREVQSKAELLSHFLDCTGGVILVTEERPLSELIPNVNILTGLAHNCVFSFIEESLKDCLGSPLKECLEDSVLYKSLDFLNCLKTPLRVTESSEVLTVEDIIRKLSVESSNHILFGSILCFRNDQFQFYITELFLERDVHARLFAECTMISFPSNSARLCSEHSCLKFLSSLRCHNLSSQTVKALGAVIGNFEHLSRIEVMNCDDSICHLLEHVRNPSKCFLRLTIGSYSAGFLRRRCGVHLTSDEAVRLASLLSRFNNVIALNLDLTDCCTAALNTLVTSVTHKTFEKLTLTGINLTLAVAKALGRSLPEMSSLQGLELSGLGGGILQAEEMEALFGGFNNSMPLSKLTFSGFNVRGCLVPLIKSLPLFPNLRELKLEKLNIDEHDQCSLLKNFPFLTQLRSFQVQILGETHLDSYYCYTSMVNKTLELGVTSLTPAVAAMLGRLLPELLFLQELALTGFYGGILQAEEMEALFGGFNQTMPLWKLTFSDFNVGGGLAPLIKSLPFFPDLREFRLEMLNIDEHDQCSLLKSFGSLTTLEVHIPEETPLDSFHYYTSRNDKILKLDVLNLTPAVAAMLGRLLPEMSSLKSLILTGCYGSILQAEEMEALFCGFNETVPFCYLFITGFRVRGRLAPLLRSFRFFPNLRKLSLQNLNMDEHDLRGLLESFQFIPNLQLLSLSGNHAVTAIVPHVINLKKLRYLCISNTSHSQKD